MIRFTSRRRHTRWPRDWSSDVCSSDLEDNRKPLKIIDISGLPNEVAGPLIAAISKLLFNYKLHQTNEERAKDPILFVCEERSEERRVGKEWRRRWAPAE